MASALFSAVISAVDDERQRVALKAAAEQNYQQIRLQLVTAAVFAEYLARDVPYPRTRDSDEVDESELQRQANDRIKGTSRGRSMILFRVTTDGPGFTNLLRPASTSAFASVRLDHLSLATQVYVTSAHEGDSLGWVEATADNVVKAAAAIGRLLVDRNAQLNRNTEENE